jgi:murein DD-endopeptidase MepM/ murein hydrolase activator NlpD
MLAVVAVPAMRVVAVDTATVQVADGFDYPVGKPNAHGYHKARGFTPYGHLGEDWDGDGGGDTDLGDPVYSIGNGIVVFAADVHLGWGNVVILRHGYYENGELVCIDSLYGHLNEILVKPGDAIQRGQEIGTIGTAHGMYPAHLHFEIRKNLKIGMNRSAFAPDFSNYYDPTQFIVAHRSHPAGPEIAATIAINTFSHSSTSYGGPTGVRFAINDRERGGGEGSGGVGHYHALMFNISSGDEPLRIDMKPTHAPRHEPFKVNRYDDINLN